MPPEDLPGESEGEFGYRGQSRHIPCPKSFGIFGETRGGRLGSASRRRGGGKRYGALFPESGRAANAATATPLARVDVGFTTGERSQKLQVSTAVSTAV